MPALPVPVQYSYRSSSLLTNYESTRADSFQNFSYLLITKAASNERDRMGEVYSNVSRKLKTCDSRGAAKARIYGRFDGLNA